MRSLTDVFTVVNRRPLSRYILPGMLGLLGLMVATSNEGLASAAIGFGRAGGSGMVHAVSAVARFRFKGRGMGPWVQVPASVLPSALNFPS